jgi:probable poly-beta-1,6-N-acetyl-D-glucosamine export protein
MYATPMFILISEVVLSHVYKDSLPKGFFKKRFLYILVPYLLIPFVYGLYYFFTKSDFTGQTLESHLYNSIVLAKWHGYFIIIIFQFYLLHWAFIKWFKHFNAWAVLFVSLVINAGYLYGANFTNPLSWPEIFQGFYPHLKLPFVAWIFYFTVAFYIGRNLEVLKKYRRIGLPVSLTAAAISLLGVLYLYHSELLKLVSSLHIGILFYTVSLFFVLFYVFASRSNVPKPVILISNYSFSIYLLHMLMIDVVDIIVPNIHVGLFTIVVFFGALSGSMLTAWLLSKVPKSELLIGQIRTVSSFKKNKQPKQEKYKDHKNAVSGY